MCPEGREQRDVKSTIHYKSLLVIDDHYSYLFLSIEETKLEQKETLSQ